MYLRRIQDIQYITMTLKNLQNTIVEIARLVSSYLCDIWVSSFTSSIANTSTRIASLQMVTNAGAVSTKSPSTVSLYHWLDQLADLRKTREHLFSNDGRLKGVDNSHAQRAERESIALRSCRFSIDRQEVHPSPRSDLGERCHSALGLCWKTRDQDVTKRLGDDEIGTERTRTERDA